MGIILGVSILVFTPTPATSDSSKFDSYQKLLDTAVNQGMPGITMAVYTPEDGLWKGASGFSDISAGITMEPDDKLHIASITKP